MSTNEAEPGRDGDEAVPAAGSTAAAGSTPAAGAPLAADPDGGIQPETPGSLATQPGDWAAPDARFAPGGPAAPTVPVPAGAVVIPKRRRKLARAVTLGLLIVVGLAGVGGGGAALALEMTRHATQAEQAAALRTELASRWERLPAGKIFPGTVGYVTLLGFNQTAQRIGIAPRATCAAALDPGAASVLRRYGCVAVLRATYVDASGTLAGTIGIAVMSSTSAANRAVAAASDVPANAGVRTFSLPGTLADQFTDAQRRVFFSIQSIGPYVFLYSGGYTDGRVSGSAATTPALADLGSGAILGVQNVLTYQGRACSMKDIKC